MDQTEVVAALRALASSAARNDTARLREVFDEVEETIKAGVSAAKVHETLVAQGFKMKFSAFQNALFRIRKERAASQTSQVNEPGKSKK